MPTENVFRRLVLPTSALLLGAAASVVPTSPATAAVGGPGSAAQAEVSGAYLHYTAAADQVNTVVVTMPHGASEGDQFFYRYTIDDVVTIDPGTGCAYPDEADRTKVTCTVEALETQDPYVIAKFWLGDRNDRLRFINDSEQAYYSNEFWLGDGNDSAFTRQTSGTIDGSGVWGQNGEDDITSGPIGDLGGAHGGNQADVLRVSGRTWAYGGNGNDRIYGDVGSQSLFGEAGNDLIEGGRGGDELYGGKGADRLYGQSGADRIFGNSGDDRLYGGAGTDTFSGGPGRDFIKQD